MAVSELNDSRPTRVSKNFEQKIHRAIESYGLPGESTSEFLDRLHRLQRQSVRDMARLVGVDRTGLAKLMRRSGVPPRPQDQASSIMWDQKGPKMNEKIHAGDSDNRREAGRIAFYDQHPEQKRLPDRDVTKSRMGDVLATISRRKYFKYKKEGLTDLAVAEIFDISPNILGIWKRVQHVTVERSRPLGKVDKAKKEVYERALTAGILDKLDDRSRIIVGLSYHPSLLPLTLKGIGEYLDLTGEKTRKIRNGSIYRLKLALSELGKKKS